MNRNRSCGFDIKNISKSFTYKQISSIPTTSRDIMTVSKKFKMDLYEFFKHKHDVHTIAEIPSHKRYCTKSLYHPTWTPPL